MSNPTPISRRSFLKASMAVATIAWTAKSYARIVGANDRLGMAFIGCGGIANHHLEKLLSVRERENLDLVATCDVYKTRALAFRDKIGAAGGNAEVLGHHSDVLARKDVDYVLIATPEHSHARLTLDALDAGKHVYCEKPLTHEIKEAQRVVKKAGETGLKLQVGVQGMSDNSYATAHEAIKAGRLGPVVEAQIDYVRRYAREKGPWRGDVATKHAEKPADLDWREWLLPVARRPWNPHHYFEWRNYRDYSGGIATDLFVHRITRLIRALGLTYPRRAVGMGDIYLWPDGRDLPDNLEMLLEYPAIDGISPGLTLHILGTMANANGNRHCIRGHEATLVFTDKGWDIVEEESGKVLESHVKEGAEDVALHHANHHQAIRDDAPLNCPPELGLYGVVAVCMGNQSWFKRRMMEWDERREKAVPA